MNTTTTRRKPAKTNNIRRRSDLDDKAADRTKLAAFAATIGAARTSMKRDACGDWTLTGLAGHLSTDGAALYASLACTSARAWTNAKRNLSFLTIHQDGDCEGIMKLARPLTSDQAEILRTTLRIRKARLMDDAALEALSTARQRSKFSPCYEAP
ncbi:MULTISPECIES: hypothetical protein [Bradyrhizobium]|nr:MULTISPECIES: hypothetical protein [Bradyrhizobium]MBR0879345.1 hypothetical protein [Bradyrhizobium liaoningense]MBR1004467.1 hypothetical protein [Bradyrhizobium liaoningense]MBR1069538.1 hypothetical protein [Bradyrhizobium liaoningense]MCP1740669.1 hypothetical protein [Bradyrhizobium japonicum]MCP1779023.1 hypothetical protein [Bradyrhizobium japonicum]